MLLVLDLDDLAPAAIARFGWLQSTAKALGATTQSPYIVVPDADVVYRRAKSDARMQGDPNYAGSVGGLRWNLVEALKSVHKTATQQQSSSRGYFLQNNEF